jgi:hypothetical protein
MDLFSTWESVLSIEPKKMKGSGEFTPSSHDER